MSSLQNAVKDSLKRVKIGIARGLTITGRLLETREQLILFESVAMEELTTVIDGRRLELLRQLGARSGRNVLGELLRMFLEQAPGRLEDLRRARREDDLSQVESSAHSLKGTCINLGLSELAKLSGELEKLARQGDPQSCSALIDAVETEYRRVAPALAEAAPSPSA